MAQDWDIKPRSDACAACSGLFVDQQAYNAALIFGEEGYTRSDYCDPCWEKKLEEGGAYSTWRGVFRMPPPPEEEAVKKENAESLLRRLVEDDDETHINVIYILAVMLERKRLLVERDLRVRDDGMTIRVYEYRKTGETFLIPDPRLKLNELEPVQAEVIAMLGGGDAKDAPADPPPDTEGDGAAEETQPPCST